ncbi:hypothetical protein [Acidithiobacillus albertensis]|uniref:hypothetical protein n=1 Tax=Acidithiobacillus albertensis TaxID=119978 RepID=UPI001C073E81|nr:hypothetical protein [Acidithiobacillus albertensis]MBU2741463.1 hypothetical protein [Acidithiobacillus albertensis]
MDKKEQVTLKTRGFTPLNRRALLQAIGLGIVALPTIAWAAGSSSDISTNFATLPPGSWVVGTAYCACSAANGNFVQPSDLMASQQNLEQAILAMGKALNTGQMQQMSALEQEENQKLQEQTQFHEQLLAKENLQYLNSRMASTGPTAGNASSGSQTTILNGKTVAVNEPGSLCNEESMAQDIGQGMAVNRQMAGSFGQVLAGYDVSNLSAMATLKNLANAPTNTLSASSIFPTAMASSSYPSPSEAAQTVAHLTEPVPPVQLTAAQKKTKAGQLWQASEHAIQAKMSMAQNALATIAAWHQPTISASYFVSKWQSMQKASNASNSSSSLPPGVDSNNKISPDGALNLMVQARYANPNWYSLMAVQTMPGAIKDLTEMEAISLRVHWESLRMSEYLAGLSADEYAHEVVTPTNNALTHLNANAMAQENGALNGQ